MKQAFFYIFALFFTLLAVSPAFAEKRVALVVGNSAYKQAGVLRNPVNDAKDMARALKALGFVVQLEQNLTIDGFDNAVSRFSDRLEGADVALFWYAGHGLQYKKDSYLMPVDARLQSELSIRRKTVAVGDIIAQMETQAKTSLLFLDACRNNPVADALNQRLTSRGRAGRMSRGLGRIPSATGDTLIVYAAAPGTIADDGGQRNSPFAASVLRHMKTPGLEIGAMLKRVRRDVKRATKGKQKPEWLSRLESEFQFKKGRAGKRQKFDARALELTFWRGIEHSKDPADFADYLAQFPSGVFARRARRLQRKYESRVAVGIYPKQPRPTRRSFEPEVVHIPGGIFSMGCVSGRGCQDDEKPVHRVTVSSFYMSKYETTFAQWDACMADGDCKYKPGDEGWGRGNRPVINVSWNDAIAYAKWLSRKTGQTWRLPTEAEWEYAARGDKDGNNRTKYSWGNSLGKNKANCSSDCKDKWKYTSPVGSFHASANRFGLHDMHGNVWEWVHDRKGKYKSGKAPRSGLPRVYRGGSWGDSAEGLRSAGRGMSQPSIRKNFLGFRLLKQPSKMKSQTSNTSNKCITIGRKIPKRIKLKVGTRFCDVGGRNEARVIKIANRAVVFLDNGSSKTCRQGRLCAFDWPVKPLFRIKARADVAKRIAPRATMEPR